MADTRELRALQAAFARHLRDPALDRAQHPLPDGVDERQLAVYQELFVGNVEGLLAGAFPVLRQLLADAAWRELVRAFYRDHPASTPLFRRLAEEFVDWLDGERPPQPDDLPFMAQLAHYEWVELALATAEDPAPEAVQASRHGDLLGGVPRLSPLCWTLVYDWPVHRIGPDYQPRVAPSMQTCLVVHRNADDDVKFLEVNAVTARLLTLIEEQPEATGVALLEQIAEELQQDDVDLVINAGGEILDTLRERGIILGTKPRGPE